MKKVIYIGKTVEGAFHDAFARLYAVRAMFVGTMGEPPSTGMLVIKRLGHNRYCLKCNFNPDKEAERAYAREVFTRGKSA